MHDQVSYYENSPNDREYIYGEVPDYPCPHCGKKLYRADEIRIKDNEIIGCEFCVNHAFADDVYDEGNEVCECCKMLLSSCSCIYHQDGKITGCEHCVTTKYACEVIERVGV